MSDRATPLRFSPTRFSPSSSPRVACTRPCGMTSFVTMVTAPMIAPCPIRTHWCTPESPPTITSSSSTQCPATEAWFTRITRSPICTSCATWQPAMKSPSSPTRVTPPPPSVPVFMVTCSRIRLRLPITSRVFSPRNFRSWGMPPMTAKGWIRVSSPISVSPSITTWLCSTTPAPSRA